MSLPHAIVALLSPEPLTREQRRAIALLLLQLLRRAETARGSASDRDAPP